MTVNYQNKLTTKAGKKSIVLISVAGRFCAYLSASNAMVSNVVPSAFKPIDSSSVLGTETLYTSRPSSVSPKSIEKTAA